jgi:hypothetical protein
MSTPPVSPPPKKSNVLWWVLGLFLAGVVILGLGGLLIATYVLKDVVQVRETAGQVEVQTPAGSIKVDKTAPPDPGLPVYPGATTAESGATVEITAPDEEDSLHVTAARYRTTDPIEKVDEWYQEKLGSEFTREGPGVARRKRDILGISVKSSDTAYISEKDDTLRVVALERKGLYTEIALARIGKTETQ